MQSLFRKLRRCVVRGRLSAAVVTLFLLRAVVPVGYMPAAFANGGPFVLCHGSSAATVWLIESMQSMDSMATRHHDSGPSHGAFTDEQTATERAGWEHCPFGVGMSDLPIAPALGGEFAPQIDAAPAFALGLLAPSSRVVRFRARAPPA